MRVDVIIPCLNEEAAIGGVVRGIEDERIRQVVVVDNGSTDASAARAGEAGAVVLFEGRRGYGQACLTGLDHLASDPPDAVLFVDGDQADDPSDIPVLLDRLGSPDHVDLVVGSRATGPRERGALLPQARFGNWLATKLMRRFFGAPFTDLGPLRVIRWDALQRLAMQDRNYGWTVEMQVRAVRRGLRCAEVPVHYRRRVGRSKVSGTLRGSVRAGTVILRTIVREALDARRH
ncbi:MAG: glycosyltransferase family 2 protein [Deltaproteobacteria bacterium]|nr:MAG: glycosyltransferase family 2 protein [Deltaproteobacteria bacterium]